MYFVLQNTNQVFYDDKKSFVLELSNKLSASIGNQLKDRLENYQNKMAIFTSNYQSLTPVQKKSPELNAVLFQQYSEFAAIGLFEKSPQNTWLRQFFKINSNSELASWPQDYLEKSIRSIDLEMQNELFSLSTIYDPNNRSFFLLRFPVEMQVASQTKSGFSKKFVILGVIENRVFQDLVKDYKAALNQIFVVDKKGNVYVHPESKYIGKSFAKHSVVQALMESENLSGAGDSFTDINGEAISASYVRVENSNLYIVTTTPVKEAFRAADELWFSLVVIGIAVVLIGLVLSVIFARFITNPLARLQSVAKKIGEGKFDVDIEVDSKDEVGDLAKSVKQMVSGLIERDEKLDQSKQALIQSEKMSAFGQMSAGIAHEVKNPLAGILGHAQLAKSKSHDEAIMKHIEFIEKETRRTKDIIENLMKFARAEKLELEPTNLFDTVHGAVDLVEHQLGLQGVKIFRHIETVPVVMAQSNQIQQVLLNLMMNAGHAMENCPRKELHIHLQEVNSKVQIRIEDTGSGMPPEVKERIFEPFFTTKPAGKGTGLGLAVTVGIVKDHNADIYVESEMGEGTIFFIDFEIASEQSLPESSRKKEVDVAQESNVQEEPVVFNSEVEISDENNTKTLHQEPFEEKTKNESIMDNSRDYLMDKKATTNKPKPKDLQKLDENQSDGFKVKIRRPKVK